MCTDFSRRHFEPARNAPPGVCLGRDVRVLATRRVFARSLKTRYNFRLKGLSI